MTTETNDHDTRGTIREGYAEIAKTGQWSGVSTDKSDTGGCCGGGGCCGPVSLSASDVATAVGYASEDLESIPDGANMGLSCGNPTAIASLREGEVVLDLGSGGGFDCFLAGPKVGASGRVIGVDMTPEMLDVARKNIESYTRQSGLDNVEFRLGEIEHLPVPDASVNAVISNCVLNLSPQKQQVWNEIVRVLKAGGRIAVSDLALLKPLPESVRADAEALIGCIAGAEPVETVRAQAQKAGLEDVSIESRSDYVGALMDSGDPLYQKVARALPHGESIDQYVTSIIVTAWKPSSRAACC